MGRRISCSWPQRAGGAPPVDLDMLDLPAWVCLHEMTHAVQLAAAPWLGPYLSDSMRMVIGAVVEAAYGGAGSAGSGR